MSKVTLGVKDVAYTDDTGGTTTAKVAEILEEEYDVMGTFIDSHMPEIVEDVSSTYAMFLKRYLKTGQTWGAEKEFPLERTDAEFRDYLDRDEWQKRTGRVIMAAVEGRSSRKKAGSYDTARPAFIDTGLYRRSFRAFLKR